MKFNLSKVGAFALPALTLTALAGAGYGGAFTGKAQAATAASPMVMIDTLPVAPELADNDTQPRFVAQTDPVSAATQPMPERLSELVAELHHSAPMSSEMRCLAGAIYFEARGEPLEGQLAVAQVIVNRAESPRFPDDYCGVVTQRSQFSFVRNGRMPEPNKSTAAWHRAKAVAQIAHQGLWDSEAADSLFFHATYVKPRWSNRKVARATIHRHVFYK